MVEFGFVGEHPYGGAFATGEPGSDPSTGVGVQIIHPWLWPDIAVTGSENALSSGISSECACAATFSVNHEPAASSHHKVIDIRAAKVEWLESVVFVDILNVMEIDEVVEYVNDVSSGVEPALDSIADNPFEEGASS